MKAEKYMCALLFAALCCVLSACGTSPVTGPEDIAEDVSLPLSELYSGKAEDVVLLTLSGFGKTAVLEDDDAVALAESIGSITYWLKDGYVMAPGSIEYNIQLEYADGTEQHITYPAFQCDNEIWLGMGDGTRFSSALR